MKVLVVGSGGREHALSWKLKKSPLVEKVYIAPGNAGTADEGENVPIEPGDLEGLRDFAKRELIDLTVVGPELPLTLGIVDMFHESGLSIFGPTAEGARIEASKSFAKALMVRNGIPTASYRTFDDPTEALLYINETEMPVVVKADGLAAGKGVIICRDRQEAARALSNIMEEKAFGEAGKRVVVEEFLTGVEASYLAVTDGKSIVGLAPAQDHKAIYEGDRGPNTGGMGAYSPTPFVSGEMEKEILGSIIEPAVRALEGAGAPYRGVLYAGLMLTEEGPRVLEFNCRFGDPETQPIMMRLESDLFELLMATTEGGLEGAAVKWSDRSAVCVVMASSGYPGRYEKGHEIRGLEEASSLPDIKVFHAGTKRVDGKIVTSGGRVLGVTGLGDDLGKAMERTYRAVEMISWEGAYYRRDIGRKALMKLEG